MPSRPIGTDSVTPRLQDTEAKTDLRRENRLDFRMSGRLYRMLPA